MPAVSIIIHLNCPSYSTCHISNPLPWYAQMICLKDVMMLVTFLFLIISAVPKCIACDVVIMNGILLMYMISIAKVTLQCVSRVL